MSALRWRLASAVALLAATPVSAEEARVTLSRSEGRGTVEEQRIYTDTGTHLTVSLLRVPVRVRVRIVNGVPLSAGDEEEVRAAALACEAPGHVENARDLRDDGWVIAFDCVRPAG